MMLSSTEAITAAAQSIWIAIGQAGVGDAAAAATAGESNAIVRSVWDFLVKGGPMMIPIGVCSLVALAVIIERSLCLRRSGIIPPKFAEEIRSKLKSGVKTAIAYCRDNRSPIANIVAAGLRRSDEPAAQREKAMHEAGHREVFQMRRRLRLLSVIAALAPVLGLLGTIFGMIKAFQTVAASSEALGKTELLAKGIYEALITTAAGLCLAIPTIIAYHWITSRIENTVHEMDHVVDTVFDGVIASPTPTATLSAKIDGARHDNGPTDGKLQTDGQNYSRGAVTTA